MSDQTKITPISSMPKKTKKKKSYKSLMKSIMKPKTTEEQRKKQKENEPIVNAKFSKVDKI